ncbi:2-isopropylmalate synthase [Halomonas sp. McH1-25]|uniref:2-isopropylmalate synthase n=1 Tax=unclassified Halomonas TaxID=2609666 RepID=UPI001EF4890B|nr:MULTISPECIES: 2-isopropylmalate synthase [unclassified Halomonas]MCG7600269.1 2-isopropylmalate synthase [Halomonas sp. McH1-25]MCP1343415.1 2-isopropylmalate synthase [Halomonas sp. FL8]MCP1359618.1 2-isopropylmalate synthase [Halomonas sp. BBD45]
MASISRAFDHRKYVPIEPVSLTHRQWPSRTLSRAPIWASVDLRDGNQALLEPMTAEQKKRLWGLLVKIGLKEIEVGFPAASQHDYDFVRWLIEEDQIPEDVHIQVLVQAREHLIERTFAALEGVERAIVHVYNSTSRVQRERVFEQDRQGIIAIAEQGARWVQEHAGRYPGTHWTFQYSPESFTSTEVDFSVAICEAVMAIWQPTPEKPCILNLPATVEVGPVNHFADQIEYFVTHLKNRDSAIISLHTHNDRGGAAAAAELGLLAGADRVEGTLLGNGERTGNMDIVTLAMNLYSQGIDPQLDLSNPDEIIQVCTECTGLPVHPRHPWIGELVYTAFSGSHQDAIRKCLHKQRDDEAWQVAYLPIDPKDLGRDYQAVIRVNSQSGKGGMAFLLERDFGISLPRWMTLELAPYVQKASEQVSGELSSQAIRDILLDTFTCAEPVTLKGYRLDRDDAECLSVTLRHGQQSVTLQGQGNGAISAFMDAWQQHTGQNVNVVDYGEHALGEGSDAVAIAFVQLNVDGTRISGMAEDGDTVSASLKALLSALNRAGAGQTLTGAVTEETLQA